MNKLERIILYHLPKKTSHKIMYQIKYHKKLDLENPTTIDEKMHFMIVNEFGKKEAQLTDKVQMRKYVAEKGLKDILIPQYGIYDDVKEIDYNELPDKFVLKPNNSSGKIIICLDKNKLNKKDTNKKMKKWLKDNWAIMHLEYQYKYIDPKIICEKYIGEADGTLPIDYKFLCFNGLPKCIMVCSEREKKVKYDYYDLNWNYLDYSKEEYKSNKKYKKPEKLNEMIEISKKLSEGIKMVRVDLYDINGKIYFGELTVSPVAGSFYFNTDKSKIELGKYLNIKNKRENKNGKN